MFTRVCNREGWYTITQARSDSLKSSCDAVVINFRHFPGIYFQEEGFFEISENKFPSKLTRYTVFQIDFSAPIISRIESIGDGRPGEEPRQV